LSQRESIEDAIYLYNNTFNEVLPQRRLSSIPLHNNLCSNCGNNWEIYQPFIVHTADDFMTADLGNSSVHNYQPSHAIAFRTVDITDQNNNSAPFSGQNVCGGGKLGIYNYWDTCDQTTAPIYSTNNSNSQFEFYNYSTNPPVGALPPNQSELANQYYNSTGGGVSSEAQLYYNDFFAVPGFNGINVQNELYNQYGSASGNANAPTRQVAAAIQFAFQNYRAFLKSKSAVTGSSGNPVGLPIGCMISGNGGPYTPWS
jgi:hypothetical protein